MKTAVLVEQIGHAAVDTNLDEGTLRALQVVALPGEGSGLHWRTRNRFQRIDNERLGMFRPRTKSVVEIDDCLIAMPGAVAAARAALPHVKREVAVVSHTDGKHAVVDARGGPILDEHVGSRIWHIHAGSFWQVHRAAPEAFTREVLRLAQIRAGDSVLDLYSGSGLFAAPLAVVAGPQGNVTAVEATVSAVRDARRSLSDLGNVHLVTGDVERWLLESTDEHDVTVLDPPRSGAGQKVIQIGRAHV